MAAKKKTAARKAAGKTAQQSGGSAMMKRKQPENLRIRSIGPGLTVNDLQKSIDWYTKVLGFVAGERWEHDGKLMGIELKAGASAVWLNQDDWAKGRDRVKGVGVRLYCNTAQDVTMVANGIKQRRGTLDHEPQKRSWGGTDFGITDPDGYRITIQNL